MSYLVLFFLTSSALLLCLIHSPLILTILVSVQATFVACIGYILLSSSWLSFILIIVFLTAIIVIFTYISSLASNELTPYPKLWLVYLPLLLLGFIFLLIYFYTNKTLFFMLSRSFNIILLTPTTVFIHKIYTPLASVVTITLINYLLLILIIIVKHSNLTDGPLKGFS